MIRKPARGNTLLEVFLALLLLSLTIFAVLSVYPSWAASIRKAHALATAGSLAAEVMAAQQAQPWYDLTTLGATTRTIDGIDYSYTVTVDSPTSSVTGTITTVSPGGASTDNTQPATGPVPLEKDVTVTVNWFSGSTPSQTSLTTCFYNYPNPR